MGSKRARPRLGPRAPIARSTIRHIPGILVLRRAAGIPTEIAFPLASVLIPRAEISLIIAQYGVSIGITPDLLAIAMTVMIGTALLPAPILAAWQHRTAAAETA
jgi:Kef-type K+ transport system membrane component KefB